MSQTISLLSFPDSRALNDYLAQIVDQEATRQGLSAFEKYMLPSVLRPAEIVRFVLVDHLGKHGKTKAEVEMLISVLPDGVLDELPTKLLIQGKTNHADFILAIANGVISYWNQVAQQSAT